MIDSDESARLLNARSARCASAYTNMSSISPVPARAGLRRELWATEILHGSVRGVISPDTERCEDRPTSDAALTGPHGRVDRSRPSAAEAAGASMERAKQWRTAPPQEWDADMVLECITSCKLGEPAVKYAADNGMVGLGLLAIVQDTEAHSILEEEFLITSRGKRLLFIESVTRNKDEPSAVQHSGTSSGSGSKTKQLSGEKGLEIPTFPKAEPGQTLCCAANWKAFIISVAAWADLESEDYAFLARNVGTDPTVNVEPFFKDFTALECKMDAVLGTHLWIKASPQMQKMLITQDDRCINGKTSGLKMVSHIGKKINKKCDSRYLDLYRQLTVRNPISSPADLSKELDSITLLIDDLAAQGQPVADTCLFSVLNNAISKLVMEAPMTVPLTYPVLKCKKEYGMSGSHLMETLRLCEYELQHNSDYKGIMVIKPVAAGGEPGRNPKRKSRAGQPCINERDFGECTTRSKCPCVHQVKEFTHAECTHPVYKELGVCPNFSRFGDKLCMGKHEKKAPDEVNRLLAEARRKLLSILSTLLVVWKASLRVTVMSTAAMNCLKAPGGSPGHLSGMRMVSLGLSSLTPTKQQSWLQPTVALTQR